MSLHAFDCTFSPILVVLSYAISALGAYSALRWAFLIPGATGWGLAGRIAASAIALGGGAIWSMHFIGMLACALPVPVAYDTPLTLLSMAVAIGVSGGGLYLVARHPHHLSWLLAGGTLTGLGVAAMHYTGMAAMRLPADMVFHLWLVVASIVIAVVASIAALWMAFSIRAGMPRLLGAVVMAVAVCGMHYTGMAAVTFVPRGGTWLPSGSEVLPNDLGLLVFGATALVLALLEIGNRVEARERRGAERAAELAAVNDALRDSEARARGILESVLDAVVGMDAAGAITSWNTHAERMFGWSAAEAIGRRLSETLIPPSVRGAHERGLERYLATGEGPVIGRRVEMTALHRDGHEFPVELAIAASTAAARPVFHGFIRDITERLEAENVLRERTLYLDTLIAHSPIAIVGLDPGHRVLIVNPAFERLFLYDRTEIVGMDLDAMIAPPSDGVTADARDVTRRVRDGEAIHLTTIRRRKDGTPVDVDVYAVPLIESGRLLGTYALYRDITEQRQLEDQLRQSQKIEAVGTLAGGIAHDFNNLLTTILGFSDLLLDAVPADSPLRPDLEEIARAGRQAESMTRQLLAFSRKQLAVMRVVDVREIVTGMEHMLRRLIGTDIEMVIDIGPSAARVKADRGHLEQVLMNLVVNARDAMPGGGTLTIEVATVEPAERDAERLGISPQRYVTLTVTDTGIGMDAETRARIFEPFFSTKAHGRGTGLGLSMVYGILKQSGGHVTVESEPGHGSRFRNWLPRVDEPASPPERREAREPAGGQETVLLIEDEPTVRGLAMRILRTHGYDVIAAENGDDGLRVAAGAQRAIDLILTDAVMPGMPVGRLIAALREMLPQTAILIMSGHTSEAIVRRGILEADIPFIQKPFTSRDLLIKVRDVLDSAAASDR